MTAPRLTASSLWRAEPCPASVVLPAVKGPQRKDAEAGARAHAALAASPPPGSVAEVAFAYNVFTGEAREIGRDIGREYGDLAHGEIPGTADLITIQPDHVFGTEYKSAHAYAERLAGVYDKPKENLQIQHNALSSCTAYGKPKAIWEIVYLATGEVKDAGFDVFDFAAVSQRLLTIWERCQQAAKDTDDGAEPRHLVHLGYVNEGPHCWRCEAKRACPLKHPERKSA